MMKKSDTGFTLIEILIVMTLLGVMMVLLFGSLKICADSWHKGENKIAQVNKIAVVYNFFQHHLAVAKPLLNDIKKSTVQATMAFQGNKQSLQFVSSFPASAGKSGLQLFTVRLDKDDDNNNKDKQLIKVAITPFFPKDDEAEDDHKEEVVLLKDVSDLTISYFGTDDGVSNDISNASWHEEWLEKPVQPRLIKIAITMDDDTFWPEMVIPLKITGQQIPQNQSINNVAPVDR